MSSHSLQCWLDRFAAAVRARDFDAGRALFAPDVFAFGSVDRVCRGRDALEQGQWRDVWERTSGYHFDPATTTCVDDGSIGWAAATWSSTGVIDGRPYDRRGRVTFAFRREAGRWLAVHSHHSFDPDPATRR